MQAGRKLSYPQPNQVAMNPPPPKGRPRGGSGRLKKFMGKIGVDPPGLRRGPEAGDPHFYDSFFLKKYSSVIPL
jgi:hypothetical protein